MKKVKVILSICLGLSLFGCGKEEKEIDIQALSTQIMSEVTFDDQLKQMDEAMIHRIYGLKDTTKQVVYLGSGATAEEVALFEFADEKAAKAGLEMIQARIDQQKEDFSTYIPEECQRLDNAVLRLEGLVVILCVSSGDVAEKIINEYCE